VLCIQLTDRQDVVTVSVLRQFLEACTFGIAQADTRTVEEAVGTFDVRVRIVTIFTVQITVILEQVGAASCPGQPMCSGRGNCSDATCVCETGQYVNVILAV